MSPPLKPLIIYGASGHARAIATHVEHMYTRSPLFEVIAFIDDFRGGLGETLGGRPVITLQQFEQSHRNTACFVSIGAPELRRQLAARLEAAGGRFETLFAPERCIAPDLNVVPAGGSFVSPLLYIGSGCSIGRHSQVMPNCTLGHDVVVGDFVTICPSVSISGHVVIEDGVFIGAGAVIVQGRPDRPLTIGAGAQVYAGAVVTKSVGPGRKVAGNPARSVREFLKR